VLRFHRGDHVQEGGTGLGLAIVHEVALAHAGRFVIGETEGGGARFELHVPAA
jgi:two-component system sensor histidine kinase TctE